MAVWDDHEVANDWDGDFRRAYPARVEAGLQAWREWFPVRPAATGEIYRSQRFGGGVELFLLDTRSHRSGSRSADDGSKTMLGSAQLAWLLSGLRASEADFKLVLTSVSLGYGTTGADNWDGFVRERDELLHTVIAERIPGVVFLSGDQHWFAAHHHQNGIKEYQAGPLAEGLRQPNHAPAWVTQILARNFGVVEYTAQPQPALTVSALGAGGERLFQERIEAGLARIQVRASASRRWRLTGAHHFEGSGPAVLDYASPGEYRVEWLTEEDAVEATESKLLSRGSTLTLSGPETLGEALR